MSVRSPGTRYRAALRSFYFFQFGQLGLYLPYFPLYLQGRDLSALEIGTVLAAVPVFSRSSRYCRQQWTELICCIRLVATLLVFHPASVNSIS